MKKSLIICLFAAMAAGTGGCIDPNLFHRTTPGRREPVKRDVISIYQLANKLNLTVRSCDRLIAKLSDNTNTVMIFSGKTGRVFINGKEINFTGPVDSVRGMLFVPPGLASIIELSMPRKTKLTRPGKLTKPAQKKGKLGKLGKIVVDAGHGAHDGGASRFLGSKKILEKNINLTVATALAAELAKLGATVTLTREADVYLTLSQRARIANHKGADLFVSIHANSARNTQAHGHIVFIARRASATSIRVAKSISAKLAAGGIPRWGKSPVVRKDFIVLVSTSSPAVLVEMGFMTNPTDLAKLNNPAHQKLLAKQIAAGIAASLKK